MKKIVSLFFILFLVSGSASAQSSSLGFVKKIFPQKNNSVKIESPLAPSGDMTMSEQATLFYTENNLDKAANTINSVPEDKRTPQDWLLLGNIFQDKDKIQDAIYMYQRAISVDSTYYKPYFNLGNIYLEEDKFNLAIENYRMANKLNNKFPYAYYNLGCAYIKAGLLKKAKIAFLKAIELKNTEADFHYNLAYTYKKLNNEKLAKQYLGFYNKLIENAQ